MEHRTSLISVITTPLGFFALSLLIVEGFLGIVIIGARDTIDPSAKLIGVYIAAGAFLVVVTVVSLMVWFIPKNLTLRGEDWMEDARMRKIWRDNRNPQTKPEVEKLSESTNQAESPEQEQELEKPPESGSQSEAAKQEVELN